MKIPMDILFFVDKDKKVVIARFMDKKYDLAGFIDGHKTRQVPIIDMKYVNINDLTGKATAAPDEEFDEFKGKAIAESRLKNKFYKRCQQAISDQLSAIIACQNELLRCERQFAFKAKNIAEKTARIAQ